MSNGIGQRWRDYRPAKGTLVWSFIGGVAATLILGFMVFDWRSAGSATEMATNAAHQAQAELVSAICVERFLSEPGAAAALVELKAENSWSQDDFIEAGGWVALVGQDKPVRDAAKMCAATLVAMDDVASIDSDAKVE